MECLPQQCGVGAGLGAGGSHRGGGYTQLILAWETICHHWCPCTLGISAPSSSSLPPITAAGVRGSSPASMSFLPCKCFQAWASECVFNFLFGKLLKIWKCTELYLETPIYSSPMSVPDYSITCHLYLHTTYIKIKVMDIVILKSQLCTYARSEI